MLTRLLPLIFLTFWQVANAAPEASGFQPTVNVIDVSDNPPRLVSQQTASSSLYPAKAAEDHVSGYVVVEFTVDTGGRTENVRVVEAQPEGVFEESALRAAKRFRYFPTVAEGVPIEVPGVVKKLVFGTSD
tara:strand:+ start:392 stop:784 length:393 start_codon:yes stop_codon:yes gene_type:complete